MAEIRDTDVDRDRASTHDLTPAQASFARAHEATPGLALDGGGSVYLYAHTARTTHRWLVDAFGRVLDCASFRDR